MDYIRIVLLIVAIAGPPVVYLLLRKKLCAQKCSKTSHVASLLGLSILSCWLLAMAMGPSAFAAYFTLLAVFGGGVVSFICMILMHENSKGSRIEKYISRFHTGYFLLLVLAVVLGICIQIWNDLNFSK